MNTRINYYSRRVGSLRFFHSNTRNSSLSLKQKTAQPLPAAPLSSGSDTAAGQSNPQQNDRETINTGLYPINIRTFILTGAFFQYDETNWVSNSCRPNCIRKYLKMRHFPRRQTFMSKSRKSISLNIAWIQLSHLPTHPSHSPYHLWKEMILIPTSTL